MKFKYLIIILFLFAFNSFKADVLAIEKIKNFEVEIKIDKEGFFIVREKIVYDFGENSRHGIIRKIPVHNIKITFLKAKDEFSRDYPYKVLRIGRYKQIKIGDPNKTVKGIHTYNIFYQVEGGMRYFKNYDELYWNVTGNEWNIPIENSSVLVNLPEKVKKEKFKMVCFTGISGSRAQNCKWEIKDNNTIFFKSLKLLEPRSGLTIALGFPKGIVKEPSFTEKTIFSFKNNWPFAIPLLVFIFLFREWWQKGKDFPLNKPIVVQYEPPENLKPAELSAIMKQKIDIKDISATIIDLAVRGYLKIKETDKNLFLFKQKNYELVELKNFKKDEDISDFERKILNILFKDTKTQSISSPFLKIKFSLGFPYFKDKIYRFLIKNGYFIEKPDKIRKKFGVIGILLIAFGWLLFIFLIAFHLFKIGLAIIISGILFLIFSFFMPKRTKKGAEAYWKAIGFKEYLSTAEKYRLKFQEKEKIFEKYLSYAIVFDIVDKWAKAFEGIYVKSPSWYEGFHYTHFSTAKFSHSLSSIVSTMNSSFSPSSGSGFSSGSSGGGSGGGGGGSW